MIATDRVPCSFVFTSINQSWCKTVLKKPFHAECSQHCMHEHVNCFASLELRQIATVSQYQDP